jgi:3-oxoacyl-[acyl-carrier protein] reductase
MNKQNKVVIITGGARGIGKALAETFAHSGWAVIVNYRASSDEAEKLCQKINSTGAMALPFQADVTDINAVNKMIKLVLSKFGRIDALINNAGICVNSSLARMSDDAWDSVIATNLRGPWNMMRACAPAMASQKSGNIINIGSIGALRGMAGCANYSAAKGALLELTKEAAREFGQDGICVNAVLPGFHKTGMGAHASPDYVKAAINESVLKTTTDINELLKFVVMLASTKTVSGQIFNWDSRTI